MDFKALTFDCWSTLIVPQDEVGITAVNWHRQLAVLGIDIPAALSTAAANQAWSKMVDRWWSQERWTARDACDHYLDIIAAERPLSSSVSRSHLLNLLWQCSGVESVQVVDGATSVLDELKLRGMRLGVISDVGFTPARRLRALLEQQGVAKRFEFMLFSDETGIWKPSTEVFTFAQSKFGWPPWRCVHAGDSKRTDVAGARRAGWQSIRYCGLYDDQSELPDADFVIEDWPAMLQIFSSP